MEVSGVSLTGPSLALSPIGTKENQIIIKDMKDVQKFGLRVTGTIGIVDLSVLIFVKRKKPVRIDFLIYYHILSFGILSFVISIFIIGGTKFTICRHFCIFTTKYISLLLYFEKKGLMVKSNRTTIFDIIHCI